MEIVNYLKISDYIQTSGQPKENEFELIKATGVDTVVNLAMPDSNTAIVNEGELVTKNNMNYIHIPVVWTSPTVEQFELFSSILSHHSDKKIWIHCALNWRVASFIFLYRTKKLGVPQEEALISLEKIWSPDAVWATFLKKNA
jgi:protein tyrosine phosphatase (PTP) superfamily phosphohydrolase (DUF442 family)